MSQTVSMLPDDDEPLPRHRPAIDEVNAVHAAAGEYLAPLGPRTTSTASFGSNSGLPPPPMSGMPASMPSGMGTPTPMGGMLAPMTGGGMPAPMTGGGMPAPMTGGGMPASMPSGMGIPTPMGGMPAPMTGGGMPPPIMNTTVIDNSGNGNVGAAMMNQQTMQMNGMAATAQAQASVGVAQTSLDKELLDDQLKKEDEHWVKSYWRPAAGWLYMLICFMDFIGFPLISMFLPLVFKKDGIIANYVPWQSLTLSNGGLIHLAFGAILGIAAFSRGQEKLAAMR